MVRDLIDAYPETFAVVEYHVSDAYAFTWGESRGVFYNIWGDGIPWFAYDGLFDAWPINTYESKFITRQAVPTDVTMDMIGEQVTDDGTYRYAAHICLEAGGTPKTVRFYMVQTLDRWPDNGYSRNTFRLAADTEDVTLQPGDCITLVREFDISNPSGYDMDDVTIVSWVQEPLGHIPAEIHQGKTLSYPYDPYDDCNANGIPDAWDIDDGTSADSNGNGIPDECESSCPADLTGDDHVNIDDIFAVLGLWGVCPDPCPPYCAGDLTEDCSVNIDDIFAILGQWGPCE